MELFKYIVRFFYRIRWWMVIFPCIAGVIAWFMTRDLEKTMPLAEDVVLKDSSADPQAEAVETTGADAVAAAINADPDNWTTYNTTLVVQGGKVLEVRRIWVP